MRFFLPKKATSITDHNSRGKLVLLPTLVLTSQSRAQSLSVDTSRGISTEYYTSDCLPTVGKILIAMKKGIHQLKQKMYEDVNFFYHTNTHGNVSTQLKADISDSSFLNNLSHQGICQ
ncbi:uncharacterized protein LOC111086972 [Limulus polyphemus]|uniref:Uncharacterized protein LOC111086972 n=1 Tax=Limulus polyphemus TaxID=6850 RepID=A0ABM1SVK5_LIMPO|nr:uncharacterized protein LOC111086972 [Limulus polyphemus]